jgi:4-hydroxy-3-methylbut-2-enyl diphosphate reductase
MRELVKSCGRYCSRVHHVQTEADLSPAWFYQAHTVGITAGTSTPDDVIDQVERRIRTFGREPGLDALEMAECVR